MPDTFSTNTQFTGSRVIHLSKVTSTNEVLKSLAKAESLTEGTVVIADEQTIGRGQFGRHWQSEPGKNLTLSIIFYPDFIESGHAFRLNMATSMALCDFVRKNTKLSAKIKWPNDIYIGDKKCAGILIENSIQHHKVIQSITGIGVNINQAEFAKLPGAISLSQVQGKEFSLAECFDSLMHCLEERYLQLKNNNTVKLLADYVTHLFRKDEEHYFEIKGTRVIGCIRGVDDEGRLLVLINNSVEKFMTGEIKFILPHELSH